MDEINNEITVKRYNKTLKNEWDVFVKTAKNHLFMFERNYMDYHNDRFEDFSMMFYRGEKLAAVLPANIKGDTLYSHGGLTYGGFIIGNDVRQHVINDCAAVLLNYMRESNVKNIYYKMVPHIFHKQAAEEDRYALFGIGARIFEVTASTAVNLLNPLKMSENRRRNINKAMQNGISVKECDEKSDYDAFIELQNEVLKTRHGVVAVHTSDEMFMLHERFPENIHLFCAFDGDDMIAGTIVYEYEEAVHTQYMAASDAARKNRALDLVISSVIGKYKGKKKWLDFGISTEDGGRYLNEGLIAQKEGFGGRTIAYELWKIAL